LITKQCTRCGQTIYAKTPFSGARLKYCAKCRRIVDNELARNCRSKKSPEERKLSNHIRWINERNDSVKYEISLRRRKKYWLKVKNDPLRLARRRENANKLLTKKLATDPDFKRRNNEQQSLRLIAKTSAAREDLFRVYGGKCACCGESIGAFLTLDHINDDGKAERKTLHHTLRIYRKAVKEADPSKYQILCFNCNMGRAGNDGVCPHKSPASRLTFKKRRLIR